MLVSVLVPAAIIIGAAIALFVWYRRRMAALSPGDAPSPSGVRLTAERLRMLSSPPWRVVYEIAPERLHGIDHVVVGSSGPIAIRTVLADRPPPAPRDDTPSVVAKAAIQRGPVDELVRTVGGSCDRMAVVYWGGPSTDAPAGHETTVGHWAVEGHRLNEWLLSLPPGFASAAQVDQLWQTVTTGIGRPDPLG